MPEGYDTMILNTLVACSFPSPRSSSLFPFHASFKFHVVKLEFLSRIKKKSVEGSAASDIRPHNTFLSHLINTCHKFFPTCDITQFSTERGESSRVKLFPHRNITNVVNEATYPFSS